MSRNINNKCQNSRAYQVTTKYGGPNIIHNIGDMLWVYTVYFIRLPLWPTIGLGHNNKINILFPLCTRI